MRLLLILAFLGLFSLSAAERLSAQSSASSGASSAYDEDNGNQAEIAKLIEQLGAPKYIVRQTAQQGLRSKGLAAFDQLLAATKHPDPEVAASSKRLMQTLTVRWSRRGDSPAVLRLLESYGEQSEQERRSTAMRIAAHGDDGIPALCRLARFDASGSVSRVAALGVLMPNEAKISASRVEVLNNALQELTAEFGPSRRPAAMWLRLFVEQQEDPAAAVDGWRQAILAERQAVAERQPDTNEGILISLHWNWLRAQLGAEKQDELLPTVNAIVDMSPNDSEEILTQALEWMVEAKANDGIDAIIESRQDQLVTKWGLYIAAIVRDKQGRTEDAAKLAEQAFQKKPSPDDDRMLEDEKIIDGRVTIGDKLEDRGYAEWAHREYRAGAESTPVLSVNAIYGRNLLAGSLFDHEKYAEAAAVLTEVTEAIDEGIQSRARYENLVDDYEFLPSAKSLGSRRDYYQSMAARDAGDTASQIELLRAALKQNESDGDLLIALFRAAKASNDETLSTEVSQLIVKLADSIQEQIDEDPTNPQAYNEWAWLISNTEGDFAKAVRYSRTSLEMQPGTAAYLDTLGRCYYAVGDLPKAITHQSEAIRLEPHTMVLQRQLEFFKQEQAKQEQAEQQQ